MSGLPPGWVVRNCRSQPGCFYFYNCETGVSQWEHPATSFSSAPAASSAAVSSAPAGMMRASHILIKHKHSRNPYSWRDKEKLISKTKAEATRQLLQLAGTLQSEGSGSFARLAEKFSDCSSARQSGDLGPFARGKMQKPFEDAVLQLRVGEMSGVVETESGVHIILRTA